MHDATLSMMCKSPKSRTTSSARLVLKGRVRRDRSLPPPRADRGAFLFVAALTCAACTPAASTRPGPTAAASQTGQHAQPSGGPWTSAIGREHPLVGRIWSPVDARYLDRAELEAKLADARFVLLGEQHDNPDHHRLQAELLASLVARGRRPAVVFELVDADDQAKLDAARAEAPKDPDAIDRAAPWDPRGWPFALYRPIVATAVDAGLPVIAGNYPRARIKALFSPHGASPHGPTIGEAELETLGVSKPLPEEHVRALEAELVASHCGHPVGPMLPAFVLAQRLRDAQMAERLASAAAARGKDDGAVLIAGAGHTRRDRGVPVYLAERASSASVASVASVAFVEVRAGRDAPADYAARYHPDAAAERALPFDAVWFTPTFDDQDPCASMKSFPKSK